MPREPVGSRKGTRAGATDADWVARVMAAVEAIGPLRRRRCQFATEVRRVFALSSLEPYTEHPLRTACPFRCFKG